MRVVVIVVLMWVAGCRQAGEVQPGNQPLSYDPPGSTVTTDKPTNPQHRRTIGFQDTGIWASNEFEGARLNDFFQVNDTLYEAVIRPENAPVNNSAWYAFKLWAKREQTVHVRLTYEAGTHRYVPKLSLDGEVWQSIESVGYEPDTSNGTAMLRLRVGPDTLWVAGQELITSSDFARWTGALAAKPHVRRSVLGHSAQGRPIYRLDITEAEAPEGTVVIISRQHPPEVTGTHAMMSFVETLASGSDLARAFRQRFQTVVVPLMNPDGVDNGHWRHNAHGVDLNRDWLAFNQPETRQVRDALAALATDPARPVYFAVDFHSTQKDVYYTLSRDLETRPPGFTDAWLDQIRAAFPAYPVNDDPSGLGSPVSKNWFYQTFGAPSLTYEVGDEEDREQIRHLAAGAAEAMMRLLVGL